MGKKGDDYDVKTAQLQSVLNAATSASCVGNYDEADKMIKVLINQCNCCC